MKAYDLFKKLGFEKRYENHDFIIYSFATDYDNMCVYFELPMKRYNITYERFVDRTDIDWIAMDERPQNIKHSASYGYWKRSSSVFVDMELHDAIHKQLLELGWIKGDVGK